MDSYIPVIWKDSAGTQYEFQVDPIGTPYKPLPGVYIFCRAVSPTRWEALYIGETSSFERRLYAELVCHHQWDSVRAAGATHIGTLHVPGNLAKREGIETLLRRAIPTPCNQQIDWVRQLLGS